MPTLTAEQHKAGGIAAAQQRRADKAELAKLRELFAALPLKQALEQPAQQTEAYIAKRLVRVRKQIDLLSAMLEEEQDPNKIDRLASAIAKLSELERQLAGRPLPGSLKPSSPRSTRQQAPMMPVAIPLPEAPKPS